MRVLGGNYDIETFLDTQDVVTNLGVVPHTFDLSPEVCTQEPTSIHPDKSPASQRLLLSLATVQKAFVIG